MVVVAVVVVVVVGGGGCRGCVLAVVFWSPATLALDSRFSECVRQACVRV